MAKVLALVDRDPHDGTVRPATRTLLTLARRLGEPVAVTRSAPDEAAIGVLGRFGAEEIWFPADPSLREPAEAASRGAEMAGLAGAVLPSLRDPSESALSGSDSVPETDLLAALARRLAPAAILIAATHRGQETAARLAIRLDSGIITDAVDVRRGPDGEPVAVQHCLAGSYFVESSVVRGVPVITVRPEAAVAAPCPAVPSLHAIVVEPCDVRAPRIVAVPKPRRVRPALDHADIVVAGGRGVGSRAAFAVLADVAEALGAAVAGSHTAAELGWVAAEARVGLTGKTVSPRLYLACGVSGSVRHRAGMQGAEAVVAIGDDPDAPIFKLAELGVVGDVRAILPALLAEIRARRPADPASGRAPDQASEPDPVL